MRSMLIAVVASLTLLVVPGAALAVNLQGAQDAAYYESANWCPHHTAGKCMARRSDVVAGIGGGRWTGQAEDWECVWFEPCSYNSFNSSLARQQARWYGCEQFTIGSGGGISARRGGC